MSFKTFVSCYAQSSRTLSVIQLGPASFLGLMQTCFTTHHLFRKFFSFTLHLIHCFPVSRNNFRSCKYVQTGNNLHHFNIFKWRRVNRDASGVLSSTLSRMYERKVCLDSSVHMIPYIKFYLCECCSFYLPYAMFQPVFIHVAPNL